MKERTLVLIKPDAIRRGLIGRIIQRFEDAGLKIVAAKMVFVNKKLAEKHYDDVGKRRGKHIKKRVVDFLTKTGPVLALVIEGIEAVDVVRKIVGSTEPKTALPGTIRGDFAYMDTYNLVHASDCEVSAEREIKLWFE